MRPLHRIEITVVKSKVATRAPNVNELFAPTSTGLNNLSVDPCQGNLINQAEANTAGTLSNLCRLTVVPAGSIGTVATPSAGQINRLSGGNTGAMLVLSILSPWPIRQNLMEPKRC